MRQRGYLVAFVLVLLAACAGGFFGGRFLLRRLQQDFGPQATWTPPAAPAQASGGQATPTPAPGVLPMPSPPEPGTTVASTIAPTRVLITVTAPTAAEPPALETATPEATPTETETASPSSSFVAAFPYVLARPVRHSSGDCPGDYIQGLVSDRAGRPLPDVRLQLADEYSNQELTATKAGSDAGRYDFPLFGPPRRFYLSVVDSAGRPLSEQIEIEHRLGSLAAATCHWVDWRQQ
jgi:hypothetical protein